MHAHFNRAVQLALAATLVAASGCIDQNVFEPPAPEPPPPTPSEAELNAVDVVFGSDAGLFSLKASGQERVRLASGDFRRVSVSPDGKRIVYVQDSALYLSEVDGTGAQEIAFAAIGRPAWSPDQRRIVFLRSDGLYLIDVDSRAERQITRPETLRDGDPVWSPDSRRIAFTRYDPDWIDAVMAVNADEGSASQLPAVTTFNVGMGASSPAWSADGSKIAFIVRGSVYAMNSDGTGAASLRISLRHGNIVSISDWSADGKWMALLVAETNNLKNYIADFQGRSSLLNTNDSWGTIVLRKADPPTHPAVIPSFSDTLVFAGPTSLYPWYDGSFYIMYPDGAFVLRLTSGQNKLDYSGWRAPTETGFHLTFNVPGGDWQAVATLDQNKLLVHYNANMMWSDFVDGTYTYLPGVKP